MYGCRLCFCLLFIVMGCHPCLDRTLLQELAHVFWSGWTIMPCCMQQVLLAKPDMHVGPLFADSQPTKLLQYGIESCCRPCHGMHSCCLVSVRTIPRASCSRTPVTDGGMLTL